MIRKIFFSLALALVLGSIAYAQPQLTFEVTEHNFDKVSEGTLATYEFFFKNTGDAPLVLSNVRASCGCTTPSWTREPVPPGESGSIKAQYNSNGRPGVFNKNITITSNANNPTVVLKIRGVVIPKGSVEVVYTEEELANSPKLGLAGKYSTLGKVEKGQSVPFKVTVSNNGKKPLQLNGVKSPCNCVKLASPQQAAIAPGQSREVEFVYTPRFTGNTDEVLTLFSNDLANPQMRYTLRSEVVENLGNNSILTEGDNKVKF